MGVPFAKSGIVGGALPARVPSATAGAVKGSTAGGAGAARK